jgi:hypothetical protein
MVAVLMTDLVGPTPMCAKQLGNSHPAAAGAETPPPGRGPSFRERWLAMSTSSVLSLPVVGATIQVTERFYELLRHRFELRRRTKIEVKGKGQTTVYLLIGPNAVSAPPTARLPHKP